MEIINLIIAGFIIIFIIILIYKGKKYILKNIEILDKTQNRIIGHISAINETIDQLECNHDDIKILDVRKIDKTEERNSFYFIVELQCKTCGLHYDKPLADLNFKERTEYMFWRKNELNKKLPPSL